MCAAKFLNRIKNSSCEIAVEINLKVSYVPCRYIFSATYNLSSPVKTLHDHQCCLLVAHLLLPAHSIATIKIKNVQINSEHKS